MNYNFNKPEKNEGTIMIPFVKQVKKTKGVSEVDQTGRN